MKLVLVHGFLGNSLNWLPIVKRLEQARTDKILASHWEFQSVDLLGHGRKSSLASDLHLSLEALALDLHKEIASEEFVGVGHSFGVRPLLKMWDLFGSSLKMKALVVEDSSPTISDQGFGDLKKIFDELPEVFESRKSAKEFFESIWGTQSKMPGFLLTNLIETEGRYLWKFDRKKLRELLEDSRQNPLWSPWEKYPNRIDMIMGADSGFVSRDRMDECVLRRNSFQTGVTMIPRSGHWVHSDQPDLFTNELIKTLNLI